MDCEDVLAVEDGSPFFVDELAGLEDCDGWTLEVGILGQDAGSAFGGIDGDVLLWGEEDVVEDLGGRVSDYILCFRSKD